MGGVFKDEDRDIVSSAWRHAAVQKDGLGLTNLVEDASEFRRACRRPVQHRQLLHAPGHVRTGH